MNLADEELVARVRSGERELFAVLLQRSNVLVYRVVRSILKNEDEVEEIMQQAYALAFSQLSTFEGRSKFSTWLTRIAINEALARKRKGQRQTTLSDSEGSAPASTSPSPEDDASTGELRAHLEAAIDRLPESYRSVFMLRDVEGLDTGETAEALGLSEENVKVRLHRARQRLRELLSVRIDPKEFFSFAKPRCDRVVEGAMRRILVARQ